MRQVSHAWQLLLWVPGSQQTPEPCTCPGPGASQQLPELSVVHFWFICCCVQLSPWHPVLGWRHSQAQEMNVYTRKPGEPPWDGRGGSRMSLVLKGHSAVAVLSSGQARAPRNGAITMMVTDPCPLGASACARLCLLSLLGTGGSLCLWEAAVGPAHPFQDSDHLQRVRGGFRLLRMCAVGACSGVEAWMVLSPCILVPGAAFGVLPQAAPLPWWLPLSSRFDSVPLE